MLPHKEKLMLFIIPAVIVASIAFIRTTSRQEVDASGVELKEPHPAAKIRSSRFTDTAIRHAETSIKAEPKVLDFVLDPTAEIELTVAVRDDGSRRNGYASYLCQELPEWGIYDDKMDVRVVDAARLAKANGDFRSISLGTVHCADNSFLD